MTGDINNPFPGIRNFCVLTVAMPLILELTEDASRNQELIQQAARIIVAGGVVAYPTETVYGLAALATDPAAIERVYLLKGRRRRNPLSILISAVEELPRWVVSVSPGAWNLIQCFWPGPLTLVFAAADELPANLTAGSGKVGVRLSSHPVAQALVQEVGAPITATSANRSGGPSSRTAVEVIGQLQAGPEAVLDGGLTPESKGSTIADVTIRPPKILRVGSVAAEDIVSCWRQAEASENRREKRERK